MDAKGVSILVFLLQLQYFISKCINWTNPYVSPTGKGCLMVCPVDPCTTWMWRCANTIASQFLPAVETRHSLLLVGGSTAAMGVVTQPFY